MWRRSAFAIVGLIALFSADFFFHAGTPSFHADPRASIPGYFLIDLGVTFIFLSAYGVKVAEQLRALVYLGKISYGLYIFHVLCIDLSVTFARDVLHMRSHLIIASYGLGVPLTILLAALSYRYWETPFLRLKERFAFVASRSI